jgi:hypothetical protein
MGDGLHQLAQLVAGRRRGDAETAVDRLVGGQMVHPGANAADPANDVRQLLRRFAFDEFLEPPQGHVVHAGILVVASVVQPDLDGRMSLDAGDRLNGNGLSHINSISFHGLPV